MKIAVVLFQLGGPDSLEAVEPFLYNLFLDPDIIDFPFARLAREPLARYIASRRSVKVAEKYKQIGGKSPILDLTRQQAAALEHELRKEINADVLIAMRYWHPLTETVVRKLANDRFDRVILLPLYPQYSRTTTGSSLNEWNRWCSALGVDSSQHDIIYYFYDHPLYIEAIVQSIDQTLSKFVHVRSDEIRLVFSAHAVPLSVIRAGDPYKDHIEKTVELVLHKGNWNIPHVLCYQSKVGPAKWLRPSLDETIRTLALYRVKHVLVVPIAFVTDHIETLHEINIEAREEAEKLGITQLELMPGLNSHPKFIGALADLVRNRLKQKPHA